MSEPRDPTELSIVVSSPAFGSNGMIPVEHAVEGANVAPPLAWDHVPEETRSIAIIVEDPDAPTRNFVHWILVGIPPRTREILAGGGVPEGAAEGINDYGLPGYAGPNPPSGRHRYFFKVFALDINLEKPNLNKYEFYAAIKGHILERGELVATYERKLAWPVTPRASSPRSARR